MRLLKQADVEELIDIKLKRLAEQLEAVMDYKTAKRAGMTKLELAMARGASMKEIKAQMEVLDSVRRHIAYIAEPSHNEVAVDWLGKSTSITENNI